MDDLGGKATSIFGSWFDFMTLDSTGGFEMPWDTGARDGVGGMAEPRSHLL